MFALMMSRRVLGAVIFGLFFVNLLLFQLLHQRQLEGGHDLRHPVSRHPSSYFPGNSRPQQALQFNRGPSVVKAYDVCAFTVASWSHFAFVRLLEESLVRSDIHCFVWFVADNPVPWSAELIDFIHKVITGAEASKISKFKIVTLNDIQPLVDFEIREMAFRYDQDTLPSALKPIAFSWMFRSLNVDKVVFLSTKMHVLGNLRPYLEHLDTHSFLLSPYITSPMPDHGDKMNERVIMTKGVFNLAFLGLSRTRPSMEFLGWWTGRCRYYAHVDFQAGEYYDQMWGYFVQSYWGQEEVYIVRDPSFIISPWNVHEFGGKDLHLVNPDGSTFTQRPGSENFHPTVLFPGPDDDATLRVPVALAHFEDSDYCIPNSRPKSDNLIPWADIQSRHDVDDYPSYKRLYAHFERSLRGLNCTKFQHVPYGFSTFSNGVFIPALIREYFSEMSTPNDPPRPDQRLFSKTVGPDPFSVQKSTANENENSSRSFYTWLLEGAHHFPVNVEGDSWVPEIAWQVVKRFPAVQTKYPDPFGKDQFALMSWFFTSGLHEMGLDQPVLRSDLNRLWEDSLTNLGKTIDSKPLGVNVLGWVHGLFGVAESSRLVYFSIDAVGMPVVANALVGAAEHKHTDTSVVDSRQAPYRVNLVIANADSTRQFLENYPNNKLQGHINIGYWAWELEKFPQKWVDNVKVYHEIWTPSNFVTNSIVAAIKRHSGEISTPVVTMPFGLRVLSERYVADRQHFNLPEDAFIFLIVFDYFSCIERKNPVGAVKAFMRAFAGDENNAFLIVKSMNSQFSSTFVQAHAELLDMTRGNRNIRHIDHHLSGHEMRTMKASVDCLLSLHRSEGYGLNLLEFLMLGKPVIATAYSGNMQFMKYLEGSEFENLLIPYHNTTVKEDWGSYMRGNIWAEPDISAAASSMAFLSKQHRERNDAYFSRLSAFVVQEISTHFSLEAAGRLIQNRISELPSAIDP